MAMVINTNLASLNAVRQLDQTSLEQKTAMERLTSGLRINKAADDAAGLAVATGMTTQIKGTEMAIRNANDGIGVLQTLDGAAEEVVSMMQRMRELSIQSLTGTYSNENRAQMQEEFSQLRSEIDRIADTTKFNETGIMNNSTNSILTLHIGWETGAENKINISTYDFNASALTINSAAITAVSLASAAVLAIDTDLSAINLTRAKWGALQNRLESTVSNLANVNENIMAARSQILDTDFAKESANLARTQVLQQAGMSMLSQANQNSQQVLSLLQ